MIRNIFDNKLKRPSLLTEYELRNIYVKDINSKDAKYAPFKLKNHFSTQHRFAITDIRGPPPNLIQSSLRENISSLLLHPDNLNSIKNIADVILTDIGGIGPHSEVHYIVSEVLENNDDLIIANSNKLNIYKIATLLNNKVIKYIENMNTQHKIANSNYIKYLSNPNISLNPLSLSKKVINARKKITYHKGGLRLQYNQINDKKIPERPRLAR